MSALAAVLVLWACGPAEVEEYVNYELETLCTVNKSRIEPEFSDSTFMFARNVDEFGLETGDRAFVKMTCTHNIYSEVAPLWTIVDVKKVPVYPLSSLDEVDAAAYSTPITDLQSLDFFGNFKAFTWVWRDKQNINIKYKGLEEGASFALAVRGVKNGYVELELFVEAGESDDVTSTLLTFDISNIKDFLSDDEKALLTDGIKTKIFTKRMKNDVLVDWERDGNYIVYF